MAPFGIQVTKKITWRGAAEEFSNVWHYDLDAFQDDAGWDELVNKIVAVERPMHGGQVTFLRARVFGPTNAGKAANIMRYVKDLSGTGTLSGAGKMPFEMTFVGQFYVGRGPKGGKQFLRKYIHACAMPSSTSTSDTNFGNAPLVQADKQPFIDGMMSAKNLTVLANNAPICTPLGKHLPLGTNVQLLNYLHTRQFRR